MIHPNVVFIAINFNNNIPKGSLSLRKRMNFRKISERGGGVISDPKNFIAIFFALEKAILVMNFRKKLRKGGGVISDLKNFIANLVLVQPVCGKNCNIFPEKGGGARGRLEIFRKFIGFRMHRLP